MSALGEERRVVSVLFSDLVGFTTRAENLDPEDVRAVLDRYYACARDAITSFGGQVEKYIGDAVMGVFGAPTAHGDDPERAVRAGLEIRDALAATNAADARHDLRVRVAVNTGEAIVELGARTWAGEAMVAGDVVNTASRLQSMAPENSVVVGPETYQATRLTIAYRPLQELHLKGKRTPTAAWLAVGAALPPGERLLTAVPVVGRRTELAALAERLEHVLTRRHAHLVTVFGQPGVGKTRLAAEFARTITGIGGRTLRGRSLPYGGTGAYGAFCQQIQQAAGILGGDAPADVVVKLTSATTSLLGPEEAEGVVACLSVFLDLGPGGDVPARHELFHAARRFVEGVADEHPTVLVFEDLQWADPSLLDLVEHLASRIRESPLMVVGLARPDFLSVRPHWGARLPAYTALPLEPLNTEEARELAGLLLSRRAGGDPCPEPGEATAAQLAATADGNPLFIEELVASLVERVTTLSAGLPTTVRGIVAARLDALPADERAALLHAAVVGKVFWSGALARLAPQPERVEEILDLLEWRDMVRREPRSSIPGTQQFRFKHMLIRDVAYATLPRATRREGHAAVAAYLEETGASSEFPAAAAHHWAEAGESAKAVEYLLAAAAQAERGWAKEEAVRYYHQALALVPAEAVATRRGIRLKCAVAEQMAFHLPDAELLRPRPGE
jgi:class 3 adenylate cyclase